MMKPGGILMLAEQDEQTRSLLQAQVAQLEEHQQQPHSFIIMPHSTALSEHAPLVQNNEAWKHVFAHVDPFQLDLQEWQTITNQLLQLFQQHGTMSSIILVFNYDKTGKNSNDLWAPFRLHTNPFIMGPVAAIHRDNFHLAVYCSQSNIQPVQQCCKQLDWVLWD